MLPSLYYRSFRQLPSLLCNCNLCHIQKTLCTNKKHCGTDDLKTSVSTPKIIQELPEEPTTCCMSGCANCVWLDYAEKISAYMCDSGEKAMQVIEDKVSDPNVKAFLLHELRMRKKLN